MPSLMSSDDGPVARCKLCGKVAVGPCATCRAPVCGDCCVLTDGGATTFAVCHRCARDDGASLSSAWAGLLGWIALIVLGLAAVSAAILFLRR